MEQTEKEKAKKEKIGFLRQIGWTSRALSLSVNVVLLMQLTYFCTNVLGLGAPLVGGLLLSTKIFDGATDFVQGALLNKVRTRFGQVRHWEFCIILTWISTILLFACPPSLSTFGKCAWVFVFSILVNDVFAGMLNSSDAIYLDRAFSGQGVIAKMLTVNALIIMVFSAAASIMLPQLMANLGTTEGGWLKISLIFGVPMGVIGMGRFLLVKERGTAASGESEEKLPEPVELGEGLRALRSNKYIFLIAAVSMLCQVVSSMNGTSGAYFFQYVVGDLGTLGIMGLLGLIAPIFMFLFPPLLKKVGAINTARGALVIGIVGCLLKVVAGTNIPLLLVSNLLGNLGILPMAFMLNIYVIDCMTYGEWKNGKRADGFISALVQLANKIGAGIGPALFGILMGIVGYDGLAAVQNASTNNMIIALYTWIPAIVLVVALLLLSRHDLDKRIPQIKQELEQRKESSKA